MRKDYSGKLIRDLVPDVMASKGVMFGVREASVNEYRQALANKLLEECKEAFEVVDKPEKLIEELADVVSVMRALADENGFTFEQVLAASRAKDNVRGGFIKRLLLDWTEGGAER